MGSAGLTAPQTVERRRGDRWLRQTQLHRKRQGEKPPAWLGSGGGCGGGARGEIIQELCRFRLKMLPAAGVHVECLSCWGCVGGDARGCPGHLQGSFLSLAAALELTFAEAHEPLPTFQTYIKQVKPGQTLSKSPIQAPALGWKSQRQSCCSPALCLGGFSLLLPLVARSKPKHPLFCGSKLGAVTPGPKEGLRLSEKAGHIGKQEVIEGLQQGSLYPALFSSQRVTQGLLPSVGETGSHHVAEAGLVSAALLQPHMLGSQICTTTSS